MNSATIVPATIGEDYLELWSTIDNAARKALTQRLFAESATQYATPDKGLSFTGFEEIEANIRQTNEGAIQKAGLEFRLVSSAPNQNLVQIEWVALDVDGNAAVRGRDCLLFDESGRIAALYMFAA